MVESYFGKLKVRKHRFSSGEKHILYVTSPIGDIDVLNGDILYAHGKIYKFNTEDIMNGVFKRYPELAQLAFKNAEVRLETTGL